MPKAGPQLARQGTNRNLGDCQHPQSLPSFKKALEDYDKKYNTLIDYFGVIGPPLDQLYGAIDSAKRNELLQLTPVVLTRVPDIDKPSIGFPSQITDVGSLSLSL